LTINGAYRASPVRAGAGPSGSSPETPLDERGQDVTADQNGSLAGYGADTVALELQGGGTVQLGNVNTYSGGTTIDGATLELLAASTTPVLIPAGTAGSGAITFAPGVAGTLKIDSTGLPTNPIAGFSFSDAIDLAGVATSFTGATVDADNRLTVAPGETLQMAASDNFGGDVFQFSPDGSGGTRVTLERLPPAKQIVAGGIWDETSVWQLGIPAVSHDNVRFMNGDLAVNLTAVGGGNVFGASYPASFAKPLQIETLEFAGSGDVVNVAGSSTFEGGVGLKTGIVGGGDAATIEIGANAKLWINGDIVQSTNGIAIIDNGCEVIFTPASPGADGYDGLRSVSYNNIPGGVVLFSTFNANFSQQLVDIVGGDYLGMADRNGNPVAVTNVQMAAGVLQVAAGGNVYDLAPRLPATPQLQPILSPGPLLFFSSGTPRCRRAAPTSAARRAPRPVASRWQASPMPIRTRLPATTASQSTGATARARPGPSPPTPTAASM